MPALLLALVAGTSAATLVINTDGSGDHTDIQQAIQAASDGDTLLVTSSPWTVNLDFLDKSLHLSAWETVELQAADASLPVISLSSSDNDGSSIEGFSFQGLTGVGILIDGASVTLSDLQFTGFGETEGGALWIDGGDVTGSDLVFADGSGEYGGFVWSNQAVLQFDNPVFSGGSAIQGGALYGAETHLTLIGATLEDNYASDDGGAAYMVNGSEVVDQDSTWSRNTAGDDGGAIYIDSEEGGTDAPGHLQITGSLFENGIVEGSGAALYVRKLVTLDIQGALFRDQYAKSSGGAIYIHDSKGASSLVQTTFENNQSRYGQGGAFYGSWNNELTIEDSLFDGNQSSSTGGAVSHRIKSPLTVRGTTFTDNISGRMGGGLWVEQLYRDEYDLLVEESLFVGNVAELGGAGLAAKEGAWVRIADTRFEENRVESTGPGGGVFLLQNAILEVERNWFVGNSSTWGGGAYTEENETDSESELELVSQETWRGNVFVENRASYGGGLATYAAGFFSFTNNSLVRNQATEAGAALHLQASSADVRNNLIAFSPYGAAVHVGDELTLALSDFSFNSWYGNVDGNTTEDWGLEENGVLEDPELVGSISLAGPSNDMLLLTLSSPLRDAGDPEIEDANGTRSDIGYAGGPTFESRDADLDGYPTQYDCDDANTEVHPEAQETWYDGVNQDCSTGSDFDADGDDADSEDHGGVDCNDADPEIQDGCENSSDTNDNPEDDGSKNQESAGGCGCDTPVGPTPTLLLAVLAALWIRRREAPAPARIPARVPPDPSRQGQGALPRNWRL
jgi:uncharacterized protein (TIGR03382 family)